MAPSVALALLLAATSSSNQYTPTFPGGIIAWIICNGRKRQQIGGWLLFYYWQLYSGAVVSAIFFGIAFQSYVPESFDDSTRYHLFLASIVPALVLLALEIAVATMLVSVRTWDMLRLLRWLMIASLVAGVVALVIDVNSFPDNIAFDVLAMIQSGLWLAYFFASRRVTHVFKSHDWEVAVDTIYPAKPSPVT
jgi:hypothetical protein